MLLNNLDFKFLGLQGPLLEGVCQFYLFQGRVGVLVFNSLFKIKKNTNPDVNIDIDGINLANVPQHIAIIMDGNGRWAKAQGKVRTFGHQAGAETLKTIVKIADKIAIFYAGTTLEIANVKDFENGGENLRHPYTKALYEALPQNGFKPIKGNQPLPNELPKGCLFCDRCEEASADCKMIRPDSKEVRNGMVRCLYAT